VVERYRYDPYGKVTVLEPDYSSDSDGASDVNNPYLYTGRRNDAESNLYQYRHRYYSWRLGRFISRDPKGYVDGYNVYQYAGGRVVIVTDAMGLEGMAYPGVPDEDRGRGEWRKTYSGGALTVGDLRPIKAPRHLIDAPRAGLDVREKLTEYYGRGGYYYGHAHCVSSCVMSKMTNRGSAKKVTQWKERSDVVWGMARWNASAYSAKQPADYDANKAGRDAAEDISLCPVEGPPLTWDQKIDAYFDRCVDECKKAGWGQWSAGPAAPSNIWSDNYNNRLKQHPELDYRDLPGRTIEERLHRNPPKIWAPTPPSNRDYRPIQTQ
jgi:RHS repeat-associated protein